MTTMIYQTERLVLKVLDKSSAQIVLDYYLRNRSFIEEWEPVRSEEFYSKEYHEEQLENDLSLIENKSLLRLWIYKKNEESQIIGSIGFSNIIRGVFLSCYLGYKLDKDEINQGYMTEAIKKGIDLVFNDYGLHRIEANVMPKNVRSLRVTEKLGFYNEGIAHKYLKINGIWEDHVHMVLLNDNV
ncbi:GNAT family N-acetyltransferase [Lacrimispora sp.]|uniref:GNAT family N-acetyltransferase n=1 Tax=Lacrimispora sp. TaxID=2719234 RepID=UPI0028AC465C|nr:GNAT family N-acetyltransferase [Lacrimispora sp.]